MASLRSPESPVGPKVSGPRAGLEGGVLRGAERDEVQGCGGPEGLFCPLARAAGREETPRYQEGVRPRPFCVGSGGAGGVASVQHGTGACVPAVVIEQGPPILEIPALPATLPDTVAICKSLRGQVMTFA